MSTEKKIPCSRKKLLDVGKKICKIIVQFILQLTPKGINQQYCDDFAAEVDSVGKLKTDEQLTDELGAQNAIVKTKCKSCYKWGMKLKTYLQRAYGKKSNEIEEFPPSFDVVKTDEKEMINTMPQLIALAKKYKTTLQTKGMDADFDTQGSALLADLDAENTASSKMESDNQAYCLQRNIAQYNLYERINYITSVGREVFENDPVSKKYFESPWTVKGNNGSDERNDDTNSTPPAAPDGTNPPAK